MIRDRKYLDWLRTQPCLVSGVHGTDFEAVEAAHIGTRGKAIKSSDDEAIPLLHSIHARCHAKGEVSTLRAMLPDHIIRAALRAYAREQYQKYLHEEQREFYSK